jgi:hypothetical protein
VTERSPAEPKVSPDISVRSQRTSGREILGWGYDGRERTRVEGADSVPLRPDARRVPRSNGIEAAFVLFENDITAVEWLCTPFLTSFSSIRLDSSGSRNRPG